MVRLLYQLFQTIVHIFAPDVAHAGCQGKGHLVDFAVPRKPQLHLGLQRKKGGLVGVGAHSQKFVAAHTYFDGGLSQHGAHGLRHTLDSQVSRGMPILVVECLQLIHIQKDHIDSSLLLLKIFFCQLAPGYDDDALAILKAKKKGAYCILRIDPDYVPPATETKQVFGITFEQGHNFLALDESVLANAVTEKKTLTADEKHDLLIALIVLKYTQSNSVCYVKDGQAIGIGAGQQSRIHCTRLAGQKADNWWLRQSPQVLGLTFVDGIKRADRDNAIDVYIGDEYEDVLAEGTWQTIFAEKPAVFTREEKRAWLAKNTGVALGSDAFFPFGDNIERAHKSGVSVIAQPGGSVRDDNVIETCNKYGMVMCFTGVRLFHH